MIKRQHNIVKIVHIAPKTWYGRLFAVVGAIGTIVVAILFFSLFLAIFLLLIVLIIVGFIFAKRHKFSGTSGNVIEGEYDVVETEAHGLREIKPKEDKLIE